MSNELTTFKLAGKVTLKHINVRDEGKEDDKRTMIDLKLVANAERRLADFIDPGLVPFLWSPGGVVRNHQIGPVDYSGQITDVSGIVHEYVVDGAKIKAVSIAPADGFVPVVTFKLSFESIGDGFLDVLAERIRQDINVDLSGAPALAPDVVKQPPEKHADELALGDKPGKDQLYDEAVKVVRDHSRASISLVQRELRIGYNRAAKLLEELEAGGVVSAIGSNGHRSVL